MYDLEASGISLSMYAPEAEYNLHNRIYNNVFYNIAGGGVMTSRSESSSNFYDNIVKNNIMVNNRMLDLPWADDHDSGHQISHRDMDNFLIENNNFYNSILSTQDSIYVSYNNRISVTEVESSYSSLYKNNLELNPSFVDLAGHDFELQESSLMIDSGDFLTVSVGSGSLSNQLTVEDSFYFSDGFGIRSGDFIQFEGQSRGFEVLDVNYNTNILTLGGSASWNDGDGVSLRFTGYSPDLGAFEYLSGVVCEVADLDLPCNGVDAEELNAYLEAWGRGEVLILDVMDAISAWKG